MVLDRNFSSTRGTQVRIGLQAKLATKAEMKEKPVELKKLKV